MSNTSARSRALNLLVAIGLVFFGSLGAGVVKAPPARAAAPAADAADPCDTPWFSAYNNDTGAEDTDVNYVGTVDPATGVGTNRFPIPIFDTYDIPSSEASQGDLPKDADGYHYMTVFASSALAIDPTDKTHAYFAGRDATQDQTKPGGDDDDDFSTHQHFSQALYRMDLTTGEVDSIGYQASMMETNRLAVDGNGTLWSLDTNGHLFSLANVKSLPVDQKITQRTQDNGSPWNTTNALNAVDHGIPSVVINGQTVGFDSLTSGDIAFDGNGTMWALMSSGVQPDGSSKTYLVTVGGSELKDPSTTVPPPVAGTFVGEMEDPSVAQNAAGDEKGIGLFYDGLAFDSKGNLYASSADGDTSAFYVVDKDNGNVTLQGTSTGNGGYGDLASCALPSPNLEISKTASASKARVGDTMTYTVTIRNTGALSATGVTFQDALPTAAAYVPGTTALNGAPVADTADGMPYTQAQPVNGSQTKESGVIPAGDSAVITFQVKLGAGSSTVCNQATAAFVSVPDGILSNDPNATGTAPNPTCTTVDNPSISLQKQIDGQHVPTAPGATVDAGAPMSISLLVTNTGNTVLAPVVVTDDVIQASAISCPGADKATPNTIPSLVAGASLTCTATYPAPAAGVQHTDHATATGTPPGGSSVTSTDTGNAVTPSATVKKVLDPNQPNPAPVAADGTYSVTYDIVVTNPSSTNVAAVNAITDKPGFAAGVTVDSVKVEGNAVTANPDGTYPIAPAGTIAKGGTITYHVVVAGTAKGLDAGQTTNAQQCKTDGDGTPGFGLFNQVQMAGDPDTSDNDACVPVSFTPKFAVSKSTKDAPFVLPSDPEQTTLTRNYTVTVSNTGNVSGKSGAVTDKPATPAGFTVASATVDGQPVTIAADGTFPVTSGDDLAAGATKDHQVVVTYTVDQSKITDWTKLGQCGDATKSADTSLGLTNVVFMGGDSDGDVNNWSCTPASGTPKFAVSKSTTDGPVTLQPKDTSVTRTYTVTVSNSGDVSGKSDAVTDKLPVPAGFKITKVTVDGTEVTPSAENSVQVTASDTLDKGAKRDHQVVVTYSVDQDQINAGDKDSKEWSQLGACAADLTKDQSGGLTNSVSMTGDSDGDSNNYVCTPVTHVNFQVAKTVHAGQANPVVVGTDNAWSVAYDVTVTNTGTAAGTSAAVTDQPTLPTGFNVTKATVNGTEVTPATGPFQVTPGVQLDPGASATFTVVLSGTVNPATADWGAAGTCDTSGEHGNPNQGLFNSVSSTIDADGSGNNQACVPATPTSGFAVAKTTSDGPATLPAAEPGQKVELTRHYTVTVKNTGNTKAISPVVTDAIPVPAGFSITGVTVDNTAVTVGTDNTVQVSAGDDLSPDASQAHSLVVTYAVDQSQITANEWTELGACASDLTKDQSGGLTNVVSMTGDADVKDNYACTPVNHPTFAVAKSVAAGQSNPVMVTPSGDGKTGTFTVSYVVTVSNTSTVSGTSLAVTDTPKLPAGFTVTSATVDNAAVTPAAGPFQVTPGVQLDAGASKSFTVTLSGTADLKQADWTAAGDCSTAAGGTPNQGLFNGVTMSGDTDGTDNNHACVPATTTPTFRVEKSAVTSQVKLAPKDTTTTVTYQVLVTNNGPVAGTSAAVLDTPAAPNGFTVTAAKVDGVAASVSNGSFQVSAGATLNANEAKAYTIEVTYAVDQTKLTTTDWSNLSTCAADPSKDHTKGLVNHVAMTGDTDQDGNNWACVNTSGTPTFAVAKSTNQAPVTLAPGQTSVTRTYAVTVSNTSKVDGPSAAVTDTPATPFGFTLSGATVDGNPVAIAGGQFTVTAGDQLAAGASRKHDVTVTYTVAQAQITDWTNLGSCDNPPAQAPTKGLSNTVSMDGDTDGPGNNTACTPVNGTPQFAAAKSTADQPLVLQPTDTKAVRSYTVTVSNTGSVKTASPAVTDRPALPAGFTVVAATVDGAPVKVAADGSFPVSAGDNLAPNAKAEHAVVVTYGIDQSAITSAGWANLGACAGDLTQSQSGGLTNGVVMNGDSDGAGNNYACTPATRPGFSVAKTTAQAPVALKAGDSSVTRDYTVTVSNVTKVDGTSAQVLDTPAVPTGFSLMSATVDGSPVQITKGSFEVTPGDALAAGAHKDHKVIVTYAIDLGASIDWNALGTCGDAGSAADTGKGLTNVVTMNDDTDGPNNNWACTPVQPPATPTPTPGQPVQQPSAPVPSTPPPATPTVARTGGPEPLIGFVGLFALGAGGALLLRRRMR